MLCVSLMSSLLVGALPPPKPQRAPIGPTNVYSIQKQHVEVDIQVQRTAETLDQGHRASLYKGFCKAPFMCQVRGDDAVGDAQYPGHDFGVAGK